MAVLLRNIICPFCLTELRSIGRLTRCPECSQALPPLYLNDYATTKPFFSQIFGWSQVGKTVYLQALTLVLDGMANVWPSYAPAPATDLSIEMLRNVRTKLAQGKMPDSTKAGEDATYIMQLYEMARWGNRSLVTRDFAGELFDPMVILTTNVPYLPYAPTTLMMVGPDGDISNEGGRTMEQLLNNYINTLLHYGVDFRASPRTVIVVLTKADIIPDLPPSLRAYLMNDPIASAITTVGSGIALDDSGMASYISTMASISDQIKQWVYDCSPHGKTFIRMAAQRAIELRFTLISSTGAAVEPGRDLTEQLAPRRVLDPYFWALEFQSEAAG